MRDGVRRSLGAEANRFAALPVRERLLATRIEFGSLARDTGSNDHFFGVSDASQIETPKVKLFLSSFRDGQTELRARITLLLNKIRLLDDVAIRFPDVRIIMAHLSHPYEGESAVIIRKHPNVYADCSALHYRPFQLYHSLMLVQEYGVWHKILFGSDYPFTTVDASLQGMRALNDMLDGTRLPRLNMDEMEQMFERDTLGILGIDR